MLVELNLLPWRDELKRHNQMQSILILLLASFLAGIILLTCHVYLTHRLTKLEYQFASNKLALSIEELPNIAAKMKLEQEMFLNFFQGLSRLDNSRIYFYKMLYSKKMLLLFGCAHNTSDIFSLKNLFMKFAFNIGLSDVHYQPGPGNWHFKLKITL